ncbi:MAG: hypothetical protein PVJ89_06145 [Planctomycetota bacterium]|jgi:DNA-directed RNA polymerase specialized sigma24 family protein
MTRPEELAALAHEALGPAAARALGTAGAAAEFDRALRETDAEPTDALLQLAFRAGRVDRAVQGEFLAYFKQLLFGESGGPASGQTAGVDLEETDLLQSVVGDLLPSYDQLYFSTRPQFLSFIQKRLKWKRLDRLKTLRDTSVDPAELARLEQDISADQDERTPLTHLVRTEAEAVVSAAIQALDPGDRRLIRALLDGEDRGALQAELQVSPDALRQRFRRARVALEEELKHWKRGDQS